MDMSSYNHWQLFNCQDLNITEFMAIIADLHPNFREFMQLLRNIPSNYTPYFFNPEDRQINQVYNYIIRQNYNLRGYITSLYDVIKRFSR